MKIQDDFGKFARSRLNFARASTARSSTDLTATRHHNLVLENSLLSETLHLVSHLILSKESWYLSCC
jgi:hypothetical protein